ncbi:hypothetical protein [Corynebacterium uterequi]|uniref:Uncharacterized protein n=1 Tax=Corynebacterium uterequi TaxID=1072256 RepID=A0A0G3HJN8_9CORY|nr:hypothetical protein [Corynebacterium uterequi]AKK12128.1 hypothetical protein CUTER_10835 [Corynebacterium uterequi]
MTVRTITSERPCTATRIRLAGRERDVITVAHTPSNLLLLNLPRRIDDIAAATEAPRRRRWWRLLGR